MARYENLITLTPVYLNGGVEEIFKKQDGTYTKVKKLSLYSSDDQLKGPIEATYEYSYLTWQTIDQMGGIGTANKPAMTIELSWTSREGKDGTVYYNYHIESVTYNQTQATTQPAQQVGPQQVAPQAAAPQTVAQQPAAQPAAPQPVAPEQPK